MSPYLFNFYAEYILRNARLDEAQAGIKIAGRNSNNLRYTDDTTLIAESEELKTLLMKVKEESGKVGLKFNIQKLRSWYLVPSVQFSSVAQSCPTLCNPMNHSTQASLSITRSQSSPKLMCIESVMPSSHLILGRPLLLLPLNPSQHQGLFQ